MGDSSVYSTQDTGSHRYRDLGKLFLQRFAEIGLRGGLYFSGMPEALDLNPSARKNSGEWAQRERQKEKGKERSGGGGWAWAEVKLPIA